MSLTEGAVATSGTAARGAHLYDPANGQMVDRGGSVTVTGPTLLWADIWATALFVGGRTTREAFKAEAVDLPRHLTLTHVIARGDLPGSLTGAMTNPRTGLTDAAPPLRAQLIRPIQGASASAYHFCSAPIRTSANLRPNVPASASAARAARWPQLPWTPPPGCTAALPR